MTNKRIALVCGALLVLSSAVSACAVIIITPEPKSAPVSAPPVQEDSGSSQKSGTTAGDKGPFLSTSYIALYEDDTFRGATLSIRLRDGGVANIAKSHPVHDEASSFTLFAPGNVSVRLCKDHTYDDDFRTSDCGIWRGNGGYLRINKDELKAQGVHDNISSVIWYVDNQLYNDRVYITP